MERSKTDESSINWGLSLVHGLDLLLVEGLSSLVLENLDELVLLDLAAVL